MKALLLIAKDNIKKRKTDACIMLLLIAIATLFMYVGVSVLGNYQNEIDSRNKLNNGADFLYYTASPRYDEILNIVETNEHVVSFEREDAISISNGKYMKEGETEENAHEASFLFHKIKEDMEISKDNIIEAKGEFNDNSIVLPYYLHVSSGYDAGDKITIEEGDIKAEFIVYGFTEDVLFSNPMNIDTLKFAISEAAYEKYENEFGKIYHGVKVKLDGYSSDQFEKDMEEEITSYLGDDIVTNYHLALNYEVMKRGTGMLVMIFMAMLTMFAVLLIVVVLIIIKFNINNSIEENIKNTGIMEACGYTSKQMIASTILEFEILGVIGVALGLILAKSGSNFIGNIISSAMGLVWDMGFQIPSAAVTILVILGFIVAVSFISAFKFKKISPLDALRNGINSHNFKKNRLKLDSSPIPLNVSLGVKSTLFNMKKNIVICLVVVILTFVTNMAIAIYNNFLDEKVLLQITGVEYTDVLLTAKESKNDNYNDVIKELEKRDEVRKISLLIGSDMTLIVGEDETQIHIDAYDDPNKIEVDMLVDGRYPEYDNEISLSTFMCKENNLEIGDTVTLKLGNYSYDYIIVGKTQGMSRLGQTGTITIEGIKHIFPYEEGTGLYVYLKDDADIDAVIEEYRKMYGNKFYVTDYRKATDNAISPIRLALKAFCVALVAVSAIVIALILLLLIKAHIIREKKQMGVYKAIGYTTKELIVQIMVSYLPVVLIGGILGGIATKLLIGKLFVICFSMFSIEKITIEISFISYIVCIAGIIIWSELIALLASAKIRRIMPYKMITEA